MLALGVSGVNHRTGRCDGGREEASDWNGMEWNGMVGSREWNGTCVSSGRLVDAAGDDEVAGALFSEMAEIDKSLSFRFGL